MPGPVCERLLIVEDVSALRRSFEAALAPRARQVRSVGLASEARQLLRELRPDLLLLDVALPDGTAFDVLDEARAAAVSPAVVVVSGQAGPEATFRLAQLGVRAYVPKPVTAQALDDAVTRALTEPADLEPHVRAVVGRKPLQEVEHDVRSAMVREALGRTGGSRRGAARLLSVSRQLLQHVLRNHDGLAG